MSGRFEQALAHGEPLVLDGGLATQLEAMGHDIGTRLWSAALLRDNPDAIVAAHLAFLEAGAECITSASYQASRAGFTALGLSAAEADELIVSSVVLARRARQQFLAAQHGAAGEPLVAASIGPFGACRHNGSEYTGNYGISHDELSEFHAARLTLLDTAGADLLACETIPDRQEVDVLHDLLERVQSPAWVSFSCRNGREISDGTPLRDMAALFRDHPRVLALGVNCTAPQFLPQLIDELRAGAPGVPIVAYPNSGETYQADGNRWLGAASGQDIGAAASEWRARGARLIGGCCRVTPADISCIRDALNH